MHVLLSCPVISSHSHQVLVAEINDVRPFARLLRGIGMKHVS